MESDLAHLGAAEPDTFSVPVVDIGGWCAGDPAGRTVIAAAIDDACRSVGFVQIIGHGIPSTVVDGLTAAIDEFFALPAEIKQMSVAPRPSINRGYSAPESERLSYSLGVVSAADLFEAFNIGSAASQFEGLDLDPEIYAENIWPEQAPSFEHNVSEWFTHAGALAHTMTSIFAAALGLADDHFARFTDHSIDVLRINNYRVPDGEVEPGQLGMGAHTDYGIVTILWADAVPGLQILRPDGTWHDVVPAPGALLINLGDLISRWSNDRWMSTLHRVVPPTDAAGNLVRRRSAAYFHDGNADAVISTLEPCRDADGGSSYDDVTVADHLAQKLGGSRGLELNEHASREAARIDTTRAPSAPGGTAR